MRKYYLMLVIFSCIQTAVSAQICPGDTNTRGIVFPILTKIEGYHNNLSIELFGTTVEAKADSFLNAFINAYPAQLGDKEISRTGSYTSSSSSLVEYHQHSNGVRLKGRRVLLTMDSEEILRSFDVSLLLDIIELDSVEVLTDTVTYPENYFITNESGKWNIQEYYEPLDPLTSCSDLVHFDLKIGRPVHACCGEPETIGVGGNTPLLFLKTGSNVADGLCGIYANLYPGKIPEEAESEEFQDNCLEEDAYPPTESLRPLYETTMSYYHLNSAFHYINTVLSDAAEVAGLGAFDLRKDIVFDPFVDAIGASNYALTYDNNNIPKISFKGQHDGNNSCPLEFYDYAEDADFIAETAFELLIREKFIFPKFETNEGLGTGTTAFLVWEYMAAQGNAHTLIGNYGGVKDGVSDEIVIDMNSESVWEYQTRPGTFKTRYNANVWASLLKSIYDIFAEEEIEQLFMPLLMKVMMAWDAKTTQYKSAVLLYNEIQMLYRMPNSELSRAGFCEIVDSLYEKYAVGRYELSSEPEFEFADFYIRDTKEVLIGMTTPEDLGNEPNNESKYYDRSPSLWNCRTADCLSHHIPEAGINNFIRVAVTNRDQGCVWTGKIEIYANLASTCDQWPLHWGGDVNGDEEPDDYYATVNGSYILAAKKVAEIDMETGVYVGDDDERIYSVGWTPWQPAPSYPKYLNWFELKFHQGFLARIKSDYDIMTKELHTNSNTYVKENNNVAQRKISTFVVATFPNMSFEPILVKRPLIGDPDKPISLQTNFQMPSYVTENNFDTLGSIRFLFPPELVDIFDAEAPVGTGFQWLNDSMILVNSPDFKMSILLDTGIVYPVVLLHQTASTGFIPFSFQLAQFDSEECYEGGQYFVFTQDSITPRTLLDGIVEEQSLLAFPNPTKDNVTIRFDNIRPMSRITVYDITGKRMFQSNEVMTEYSFSTLQWPGGFYVARVQDEKGLIQNVSFVHSTE